MLLSLCPVYLSLSHSLTCTLTLSSSSLLLSDFTFLSLFSFFTFLSLLYSHAPFVLCLPPPLLHSLSLSLSLSLSPSPTPFPPSLAPTLPHSLHLSLTLSLTCLLPPSLPPPSLPHSLTPSPTPSLTHSLPHSLPHSLTPFLLPSLSPFSPLYPSSHSLPPSLTLSLLPSPPPPFISFLTLPLSPVMFLHLQQKYYPEIGLSTNIKRQGSILSLSGISMASTSSFKVRERERWREGGRKEMMEGGMGRRER